MALWRPEVHVAALLGLAHLAAGAGVCRGSLNISGSGSSSLYASGHGGGAVHGDRLVLNHNSGFSITSSCNDDWDPNSFKLFQVLGKTLSFRVDLSKVGCACNVGAYFVPLPARDMSGHPTKGTCSYISYYCDANAACGQACPELDVMQANKFAFAATPRNCGKARGEGHYEKCDKDGCGQNTNTMGVMDYGPGAGYTVDTRLPFTVHTDFYGNGRGAFSGLVTRLEQGTKTLTLEHSGCDRYLPSMVDVMTAGMSLRIAYWGSSAKTMAWLDDPPCSAAATCSGANAGNAVISDMRITSHPDWNVPPAEEKAPLESMVSMKSMKAPLAAFGAFGVRLGDLKELVVRKMHSYPVEKFAVIIMGISFIFLIPSLIAYMSYICKVRERREQQQRSLMPAPQLFAVSPKIFAPKKKERETPEWIKFFSCCCRRSEPQDLYSPVNGSPMKQHPVHLPPGEGYPPGYPAGYAELMEWKMQQQLHAQHHGFSRVPQAYMQGV